MKNLCLKNEEGKVVRLIPVDESSDILVVRAPKDQRISFRPSTEKDFLKAEGWDILKELSYAEASKAPLTLTPQLVLAPCDEEVVVAGDLALDLEDKKTWKKAVAINFVLWALVLFGVFQMPKEEAPLEIAEEVRQVVVKIAQQKPEPIKLKANSTVTNNIKVQNPKTVQKSVSRMGALGVLGQLNGNKAQKGGLDLGAVKTSAGPGLGGGTQGSGGVQTSLYGKGIVSAPLGVGGNLKGAGGYGTKGKGGGQAGYGTMSLVGSSGSSVIPVGQEIIAGGGGLDQSDIFDVIKRNQGQIRFCYEQGLQSNPNLKGRVTTAFTIGGNGQVTVVNIANSTMNSKIVEDCIALRIKTWKFPLTEGGKEVSVKIPFDLNRQGRG